MFAPNLCRFLFVGKFRLKTIKRNPPTMKAAEESVFSKCLINSGTFLVCSKVGNSGRYEVFIMEILFKLSTCVKLCCQYTDILRATHRPHSVIFTMKNPASAQRVADMQTVACSEFIAVFTCVFVVSLHNACQVK
jgi:hypothetical protein